MHLPALLSSAFGVSSSEARRLLSQGGVKLDGEPVSGDRLDVPAGELEGRVIQVGKRRFAASAELDGALKTVPVRGYTARSLLLGITKGATS